MSLKNLLDAAVCDDFDVCEACEGNGAHNHHALLKIRNPAQAPAGIMTILREEQPGPDEAAAAGPEDDEDWRRLRAGEATWGDISRGGRRMFRRWFGGRGGGGGHHHHHHHGGGGGGGGGWGGHGGCGRGRSAERRGGCGGHWRRGASADSAVDSPADAVAMQEGIAASVAGAPAAAAASPAPAAAAAASPAPVAAAPGGPRAHFVAHVTLGDSASPLTPGARLDKVWRLRNEGSTAWPEGWCVRTFSCVCVGGHVCL